MGTKASLLPAPIPRSILTPRCMLMSLEYAPRTPPRTSTRQEPRKTARRPTASARGMQTRFATPINMVGNVIRCVMSENVAPSGQFISFQGKSHNEGMTYFQHTPEYRIQADHRIQRPWSTQHSRLCLCQCLSFGGDATSVHTDG